MQRSVRLPRDEHQHRADYEWWYGHGYLQNEAGRRFGYIFAFCKFDSATLKRLFPKLKVYPAKTVYQLQFGLTDITGQRHHYDEYTFVPWPGVVGVRRFGKLNVYFGHNHFKRLGNDRFELRVQHHRRQLHLHMHDGKGPVVHGNKGLLTFPKTGTTIYYSHPRLSVQGAFETEDGTEAEFVSGSGWVDHQWGRFAKGQPFSFWNWAGIQLDDGSELMVYETFLEDGVSRGCKVTWFGRKGERKVYKGIWQNSTHWRSPKTHTVYPVDHHIRVPDLGMELTLRADMRDQEMYGSIITFWEGACSVTGKRHHAPITGKAFVELTGYDRLSPKGRRIRLA